MYQINLIPHSNLSRTNSTIMTFSKFMNHNHLPYKQKQFFKMANLIDPLIL